MPCDDLISKKEVLLGFHPYYALELNHLESTRLYANLSGSIRSMNLGGFTLIIVGPGHNLETN